MFRGKSAMNGEGQTGGGSPFNHLGVAVEEQNRTAKAVKTWHATSYSNGKKRVYVTFEEVKTVGA